jgi:hypothetical protein
MHGGSLFDVGFNGSAYGNHFSLERSSSPSPAAPKVHLFIVHLLRPLRGAAQARERPPFNPRSEMSDKTETGASHDLGFLDYDDFI